MVSAAVRSEAVILLWFILVCCCSRGLILGHRFVLQHCVSFLALMKSELVAFTSVVFLNVPEVYYFVHNRNVFNYLEIALHYKFIFPSIP